MLEFFSPLTIILGKNGSGKTTILEVLGFIIGGSFPPFSIKARSFLRNPKLDN